MRFSALILSLLLLSAFLVPASALEVEGPGRCLRCGMDRVRFARSCALVLYADGGSAGTCSLHCALEEMGRNQARPVARLKVADYRTRVLLDAERAVWVVGGDLKGVMTSPAKWAFSDETSAEGFLKEHGGKVLPYPEVTRQVLEEIKEMNQPAEME